jgi:hypothetical protein
MEPLEAQLTAGELSLLEDREGTFTGIHRLGKEDILVGDNAGKFEVTLGEITTRGLLSETRRAWI